MPSSRAADLPFLIAGGGIGGCAAGLALARRGYRAIVLEQAEEFGEVGAGIQLGPNAFKMFARLGITEAIDDLAVRPSALVMRDGLTGETVMDLPVNTPQFARQFEYPYAVIYRPDLHKVLIDACRSQAAVELRTGAQVTGHIDHGDRITLDLRDGETLQGAALIGADGLWSQVRRHVIGDGEPRVSGHIAYRAVLHADQVPDINRSDAVVLWAGPRTHLVHYPLHRGEIYNLVAVFHSERYEEGWDVFGDTGELTERFAGQHAGVRDMLDKIDAWRMWVLCDREPARRWSSGRVTLLGDAAHPMLQYLAQGACMALEDAVCLAACVSEHGDDHRRAFEVYQSRRYLRTARVQLTARLYGDVYHAAGATADLRAQMLGNRPPEAAYQGMKWLYDGIDDDGAQCL